MLRTIVLCALCASVGALAGSSEVDAGANPIRKIATLLQDMQKEIEAEGAKDKELYEKFMCFCTGGEGELKKAVADAATQIETLSSQEKEQTATKLGLEGDLVKHKADRSSAMQDLDK